MGADSKGVRGYSTQEGAWPICKSIKVCNQEYENK